ncbi:MAG: UDP-3-O-(3-hydroxymyristoyl)glucosamine N-acyltransferase [Planctomycetota bacterium]
MSEGRTITAGALAELCGGTVEGDASLELRGPAGLDDAAPDEVSFLAQESYAAQLATTRAGAVLLGPDVRAAEGRTVIRCTDPERAFTAVVVAFAPQDPGLAPGVHPAAVVDPSARLGEDVRVGATAVVGPGAVLGDGVRVHPGAFVGAFAEVGAGTELMPRAVLYARTEVGERCIVHAGAVLGADGFGFHFDGGWKKTPQVGRVVLEDDVEVGANTAIDCARFGATRIGAGTKIDNLVHVAHNCQIGRGCLLLAHVGIAGSTVVEDGVILAGQVGVGGHLRVGKGARVKGGSGVTKNVPPGEEWFGYPAGPSIERFRQIKGAERAGAEVRKLKAELRSLRAELEALRDRDSDPAAADDPNAPAEDTA